MVARLPLRTILRDIFMMMCGSFLGILLARGFATHDLRASEMSEICGTVRMTKKMERSKVDLLPLPSQLGSDVDIGSSDHHNNGGGGSTQETYPHQGYAGSEPTEKSGWSLETESLGSGDEDAGWAPAYWDRTKYQDATNHQDTYQDRTKHYQDAVHQDSTKHHWDATKFNSQNTAYREPPRVSKLLVGVVMEEGELPRTVKAVMETWGQSSSNVLFYSIPSKDMEGRGTEQELWVWHGSRKTTRKRKGYGDIVRVVRVNEAINSSRTTRILPILHHMYSVLLNQSDWFMYVPHNTYVRLMEMERLLKDMDPYQPLLLGRPHDDTPARSNMGGCDEGKGVVVSRQLLRELGGAMEAGVCREEGEEEWECLYRHLQVQCNQVSQVLADATDPYYLTVPSAPRSPSHSLFATHHEQLLQDLEQSEAKVRAIRYSLARNAHHTSKRRPHV